jgi:hypothetical protein
MTPRAQAEAQRVAEEIVRDWHSSPASDGGTYFPPLVAAIQIALAATEARYREALEPFAAAWQRGVRGRGEHNIKKYVEAEDFEAAFHAITSEQESSNAETQQTPAQPAAPTVHSEAGTPKAEAKAEEIVKRWAAHSGLMEDERIFVCGNMDELVRDIAAAILAQTTPQETNDE